MYYSPQTISIRISLVRISSLRTIVLFIQNSIIVHIRITDISFSVPVSIFLIQVGRKWAIVASITQSITVTVSLVTSKMSNFS